MCFFEFLPIKNDFLRKVFLQNICGETAIKNETANFAFILLYK